MDMLTYNVDFCVVGGGLAGMCAAVAAARGGARVALIHERPVLGGNASSEIRMWVCGAGGHNNRETGILEEINLENLYRNPYKLYPVWDSVLYGLVRAEPNIRLFLNCSCCAAETDGSRITSVTGWQMTTQEYIRVNAALFADCSGDSVLAPLAGAEFRVGREAAHEFGENVSVQKADRKTMGMSCLIQARKLEAPVTYKAPDWAKKLTADDMKRRRPNLESSGENFWYLELGGNRDSIADTEEIRDELVALAFGFWDYVKNSGEFDADRWQLDFVGFLPGKRESRRMVGKYIMTQNDVAAGGRFDDTVAYGGWPLDDHDPDGFYFSGQPCVQIPTPSPYGIPYRCLYSANIENLFFAGRNISMTHAAMSSARVMATCALLGQAVGTAASVAIKYSCGPDEVYRRHLDELQQTLLYSDCMLPCIRRRLSALTQRASLLSGSNGDVDALRDGNDRENGFLCGSGDYIEYSFARAEYITEARIVFDSDLDRATLPGDTVERGHSMRANIKPDSPVMHMPKTLCRSFNLEIYGEDGDTIARVTVEDNKKRLVLIPINKKAAALRLTVFSDWGENDRINIFAFDLK
jgi:hypothetical protein